METVTLDQALREFSEPTTNSSINSNPNHTSFQAKRRRTSSKSGGADGTLIKRDDAIVAVNVYAVFMIFYPHLVKKYNVAKWLAKGETSGKKSVEELKEDADKLSFEEAEELRNAYLDCERRFELSKRERLERAEAERLADPEGYKRNKAEVAARKKANQVDKAVGIITGYANDIREVMTKLYKVMIDVERRRNEANLKFNEEIRDAIDSGEKEKLMILKRHLSSRSTKKLQTATTTVKTE